MKLDRYEKWYVKHSSMKRAKKKECTRVWKYMFIKLYTSIYDPNKCMSSDHHIHAPEMS